MKKTILFLGALVSSLLQAQTELRLNINHLYDSSPIAYNTTLTSPQQEEFNITRLEYYITGITFTHDGGQTTAADAYVLVNADQATNVSLGNYSITNLEAIEFGIGVSADVNHLDPSTYSMGHALAPKVPSMHWGWASGYRFIAYEGNAGTNLGSLFQFHALGDDNFHKQTITTSGVVDGTTITVKLNAEYKAALNDITVADGPIKHGESYPECIKLIDNFKTSVFSVAESVSVVEEDKTELSVYPNPTTHSFMVEVSDDLTGQMNYKVIDALGKTVIESEFVKGTPISTTDLSNGIYFIEIQKQGSSIAKQSFIVNK